MTNRRLFIIFIALLLAGVVLCVALAAAASAQPCEDPDPCGGEPAQPLPVLYLPSVQRNAPAMAAEYTPVQPVATVTPEVQP